MLGESLHTLELASRRLVGIVQLCWQFRMEEPLADWVNNHGGYNGILRTAPNL